MQCVWNNSWSVLKLPLHLKREDVQDGRYVDWVNLPLTSLDKEFDQFCFYISYYQMILLPIYMNGGGVSCYDRTLLTLHTHK